jgi:hypothetical protein
MTPLQLFEGTLSGPWTTGELDVQYRVEDGVLYLQPSMSNTDWALNFLFPAIPYKRMADEYTVHAGFFLAYKANAEAIQALDFHTIAGFSLGAAIAVHAHEDRLFRTGKQPETHLFGCPCAIGKASESVLSRWSNVTRYETPLDLVALVFRLIGYKHVGSLVKLGGTAVRSKDTNLITWLSGHTPDEYLQRISKLRALPIPNPRRKPQRR